jgi:hypothetical protein
MEGNDEFRMTNDLSRNGQRVKEWSRIGAKESVGDLGGGLGAHVEDLGVFGERRTGLLEETTDGAGIAGGDAEAGAACDGLEPWIAMCGHLAEIGDGLKTGAGFAELAEDFVFHA